MFTLDDRQRRRPLCLLVAPRRSIVVSWIGEAPLSPADPQDTELASAALAEVALPQLPITKQFFSVHRLCEQNSVALVMKDDFRWLVYLRIHDEPYFWVAAVEQGPDGLSVEWGYSSALSHVYLKVFSDSLTPDQITSAIGIEPSETALKGNPMGGRPGAGKHESNYWCYHPAIPEAVDFDAKLQRLLAQLSEHLEGFRSVKSKASGVVQVAYYEYAGWASGWHLDRSSIVTLSELGLELDVDLYVSGPELGE